LNTGLFVDDDGKIIGVTSEQLKKDEKTIIEICNDSIKPVVNIATQKLLIEGKNILKIHQHTSHSSTAILVQ
jgi:hypothetical protein